MTYSDGRVYEGSWVNDERNGRGKMTYSDGSVYNGYWSDGQKWNFVNDNFLKLPFLFNDKKKRSVNFILHKN